MALTEKQIGFCKLLADGKSASEAYRQAFKSTSSSTCKVNGSKLAKRPDIKAKVKELQKVTEQLIKKAQKKAIDKTVGADIMDKAERMSILTQIGRGQIKLKKLIVVDKIVEEWDVVPDYMDRKNAIAELNKMDGSYSADKIEHSVANGQLPSWLKPK